MTLLSPCDNAKIEVTCCYAAEQMETRKQKVLKNLMNNTSATLAEATSGMSLT